jgi:hypothetical protein
MQDLRRAWSLDMGGSDCSHPANVRGFLAGPMQDLVNQNPPATYLNVDTSSGWGTSGTDQTGSLMDLLGLDPGNPPYLLEDGMDPPLGVSLPWSLEGAQDPAGVAKTRAAPDGIGLGVPMELAYGDGVPSDLWQALQGSGGSMGREAGSDSARQQASMFLPRLSSVPQFLMPGTPAEALAGQASRMQAGPHTARPSMAAPAGGQESAFTMHIQTSQAPQQPSVSGYPQRSPGSPENPNALPWSMQPPPGGPSGGIEGPSAVSARSWSGSAMRTGAVWGPLMGEGVQPRQASPKTRQYSWLCNCETPDQLTGLRSTAAEVHWTGLPQNQGNVYLPSDQVASRVASLGLVTSGNPPHGPHSRHRKWAHERGPPKMPQLSSVRQALGTIAKAPHAREAPKAGLGVAPAVLDHRNNMSAAVPGNAPRDSERVTLPPYNDMGDSGARLRGASADNVNVGLMEGAPVSDGLGSPLRDLSREDLGRGERHAYNRYRGDDGDCSDGQGFFGLPQSEERDDLDDVLREQELLGLR